MGDLTGTILIATVCMSTMIGKSPKGIIMVKW